LTLEHSIVELAYDKAMHGAMLSGYRNKLDRKLCTPFALVSSNA